MSEADFQRSLVANILALNSFTFCVKVFFSVFVFATFVFEQRSVGLLSPHVTSLPITPQSTFPQKES